MKKDLKLDILETARELFNEYGYDAVSMRDIAGKLGISVGNLTYHYRKKDELVEAIVTEQHKRYRKMPVPRSLSELDDLLGHMLAHQQRNIYYFYSYRQLGRISETIDSIQRSVIEDICRSMGECIAVLRDSGLMQPDSVEGQGEMLVEVILSVCVLGLLHDDSNRRLCIWSTIYPLLTAKGKEELRNLKIL